MEKSKKKYFPYYFRYKGRRLGSLSDAVVVVPLHGGLLRHLRDTLPRARPVRAAR